MTIGLNNRNDAVGNGAVSTYPYSFKIFAATDLKVTVRDTDGIETVLAYPTHFTVSGVGNANGGNVALVNGGYAWQDVDGDLLTDYSITIRRVRPLTQSADIRNQGAFFPDTHEDQFDHFVMIDQQQQDEINRSLKLPETESGSVAGVTLPIDRSGLFLAFNALGEPVASSGTGADSGLRADLAASTGGTLLGFLQAGTGAVLRTAQDKNRETLSAADYGEDLQVALNAASAAGNRNVLMTSNHTYTLTQTLTVPSGCGLVGEKSSVVYAPAASFNNVSLDLAERYGANAAVIDASGLTASPFTANENIVLRGFTILSEVSDGRSISAVVCRNVVNPVIEDLEIFGFPVGAGIRAASLVGGRIFANYIHDFTDDTDWGAGLPQITGIELDQDRVNSVYSYGVDISHNRIVDITLGAIAVAAHAYQTDGINVAGTETQGTVINDNYIRNVGEGIDTFGNYGTIADNVCEECHIAGIKLVHGARFNSVSGNVIRKADKYGITLAGSSVAGVGDTERNEIFGNTITDMGYAGDWAVAGVACISCNDEGGTVGVVKNNHIHGNILDGRDLTGDGAGYLYVDIDSSNEGNICEGNRGFIGANQEQDFPGGYRTSSDTGIVRNNHPHVDTLTVTITGTIDPFCEVTALDSSGGAIVSVLADGTFIGQRKTIVMTDAAASSTVEVTTHVTSSPEVFTFAQVGDYLVLEWNGAAWVTIANNGVTV